MTPKKLDPESIYNKYDINHDGTVSDEEMARNKELLELELQEQKSETQKQMAWVAMISMIIGTIFLAVCLWRGKLGHFNKDHHFGFEAAAWYWHFVDVVWLFLFAAIYVWGS